MDDSHKRILYKNKERKFSFLQTSKLAMNMSDILKLSKSKHRSEHRKCKWQIESFDEDPFIARNEANKSKQQRRSVAYKQKTYSSIRKICSLPSSCIASPVTARKSKESISLQEVFSSESFYCTPTINRSVCLVCWKISRLLFSENIGKEWVYAKTVYVWN